MPWASFSNLFPAESSPPGGPAGWREHRLAEKAGARRGHNRRAQWLVIGCAILILSLAPPGIRAQQTANNVILESSEQIFCLLAAINAAGYDTGLDINSGDDTRDEVRAYLARKNASVVPQLRKFYLDHRYADDAGADLGQYVSLGLLLGPPPDFNLTVNPADLPPDARDIYGVLPLIKTFYEQADLEYLWARLQPRYQAAIARYSEPVRNEIVQTDAYLRSPSGAYLGRTYAIDMCLLGAPEQVQGRIYRENYYLVVTPSLKPKLKEVRYQYLHFLLDPLAVKYAAEIQAKSPLQAIARKAPELSSDFREDFPLLLTECLIRAIELRMDKTPKAQADKSVHDFTASGLILIPYFYSALADYERQDASLSVFYKNLVLGINLNQEQQRLAAVKFATQPAAAPKVAKKPETEEQRLVDQGDNDIYEQRYADARTAFAQVLEKINPKNEQALFGMAVVASNTRKPDLAEEYFQKTLETAHDLRLVTWSHIYLGRLGDLEGKRKEALSQYQAATLTAGKFPDAERAVQSGLAQPFGSKK